MRSWYYKVGTAMAVDLKHTAHRVRQAVDEQPPFVDPVTDREVNPRKRRLVLVPDGQGGVGPVRPELDRGTLSRVQRERK